MRYQKGCTGGHVYRRWEVGREGRRRRCSDGECGGEDAKQQRARGRDGMLAGGVLLLMMVFGWVCDRWELGRGRGWVVLFHGKDK